MKANLKAIVPTVRAQWLGQRMRDLRVRRGLPLRGVADYLDIDVSTLVGYESARWPFRRDHVSALLDMYCVFDDLARVELVQLAESAWRANRWDLWAVPAERTQPMADQSWLEERAEEGLSYGCTLVPRYLQTRRYAEVVLRQVEGPQVAEHVVEGELSRRTRPTDVFAVVEEAALCRPVGGVDVLREQLDHLAEVWRGSVRVLPTSTGMHAGHQGAFTLLRMPSPYPPVAMVEHLGGSLVVEADGATRYAAAYRQLADLAMEPSESVAHIERLRKELA